MALGGLFRFVFFFLLCLCLTPHRDRQRRPLSLPLLFRFSSLITRTHALSFIHSCTQTLLATFFLSQSLFILARCYLTIFGSLFGSLDGNLRNEQRGLERCWGKRCKKKNPSLTCLKDCAVSCVASRLSLNFVVSSTFRCASPLVLLQGLSLSSQPRRNLIHTNREQHNTVHRTQLVSQSWETYSRNLGVTVLQQSYRLLTDRCVWGSRAMRTRARSGKNRKK